VETIYLPQLQTAPPFLGLPDGACVVSANKCIGYGASGTQEELHVGTSPEAYPAVLLAPPLTDRQVLICRGAEAMVSIRGYGRDAQLHEILPVYGGSQWRHRTMLFMDALELDVLPVVGDSLLPDIHPPSRLSRDMVLKAYNGFSSSSSITDPPYRYIVTGLWGCRTFGGNKHIKCTLQWCAAALAGVPVLKFVLAGTEEQRLFRDDLGQFVTKIQETSNVTVRQIFEILLGLKKDVEPEGIFDYVIDQLGVTD
jgi:poly(ADP-ribose) glycohydrolase